MNPDSYCLDLKDLRSKHIDLVGSKAVKLGELKRLGFSVPNGICITAEAYVHHLAEHGIDTDMQRFAQADADQIRDHLLSIRNAICAPPLCLVLKETLESVYPQKTVAVRSSATAEDLPEASFAGQYDTILNVTSLEDCYEAIKQCWASLWTERAYHYRVHNSIDHQQVRMAVIIQEQVDADMAGVAFSVDPITGSQLRIVIEAFEGLGENLVSGRVTPERWVWRKPTLNLLMQDPHEETKLDKCIAKQLARQVRKIEKKVGGAQDVEWALKGKQLYFLQTRPVTTQPKSKTWEEKQVWTNLNLGEVVPDVCTPMTFSMLDHISAYLFAPMARLFGVELGDHSVMGKVAGRMYFNINLGMAIGYPFWMALGRSPFMEYSIEEVMGGHHDEVDIPEEDLPDLGFTWWKFFASIPKNIWALYRLRPSKASNILKRFEKENDQRQTQDFSNIKSETLARTFCQTIHKSSPQWNLLMLLGRGWSLPLLDKATYDWLAVLNEKDDLFSRLFVAQGGMSDTEAGLALWQLAQLAHKDQATETAILSGDTWEDIQPSLDSKFLQAWNDFMTKHGHHCRGELELINARWSEHPDYILQMVRSYLESLDGDLFHRREQQKGERDALVEACCRRLKNPIKRWLFKRALPNAQQALRERENWKNEAVRWMASLRQMLLVLGERLVEQGVLETLDDIFFLTIDEIEPVVKGKPDFQITEQIQKRRKEYEWHQQQNPTFVIAGIFDPDKHTVRTIEDNSTELKGHGVSAGIVTGPARVILHANDQDTVAAGEILVAPFTDPAWTPYFVPAAGVVMDLGGALSHGAIIAREYGLPAVVNARHATQVIKTGQIIEVDGSRGTVRILQSDGMTV